MTGPGLNSRPVLGFNFRVNFRAGFRVEVNVRVRETDIVVVELNGVDVDNVRLQVS